MEYVIIIGGILTIICIIGAVSRELNLRRKEALWDLFKAYTQFGNSWFCKVDRPEFNRWTRKEPVYSKDGVLLGYNYYLTEEGIQALKEYRGGN